MSDLIDRQMLKADLLCGDNTEHDYCFPCKKILERIDNQPAAQPEGRSGVFIPDITVEMFRNASLEGVEDLMASGEMEDISLPSAQSTMGQVFDDDCVSRQAALECLEWHYPDALPATKIKELPSVKPERPKGEWITDDLSGIISCSRCGNDAPMETTGGGQYKSKFCPDCGADMRGEQNKELLETDVVTVFEVLKAAHDKIKEWSKRSEQDE